MLVWVVCAVSGAWTEKLLSSQEAAAGAKKLQLALESVAAGTQSPAASLDHNWVTSK